MTRSLAFRLFFAILGTVLVAVGASLAIGIVTTRDAIRDSAASDLSQLADNVARGPDVLRGPGGSPPPPLETGGPPGGAPAGRPGPTPIVVSRPQAGELLPESALASLDSTGSADGETQIDGRNELFAARRISGQRILVLTRPNDFGGIASGPAIGGLLLASIIGIGLAALAAALLSPRLAAPMRRAAAAARELAAGRPPPPLPTETTTEAAELVGSMNDLASQLETARQAERAVLLSVSHELRTPLTAIRGYAEAIRDGAVDPQQAGPVIVAEANGLELLVQDLLALARLDQGVLEVRAEPVDLAAVCEEAMRRFGIESARRGVEMKLEADPGSSAVADHARVLQVVANLVDNALRVTPEGGRVTIAASNGRIVVADTGPGIEAADLPHAFERFHLHSRQPGRSKEGAGVGLAIVRELTELMGGSVRAESEAGSGATFTVTLPVAAASASG